MCILKLQIRIKTVFDSKYTFDPCASNKKMFNTDIDFMYFRIRSLALVESDSEL